MSTFLRPLGIFSILVLALLLAPAARAQETLRTKTAEGEQCIVCGAVMTDGDVVELRYKGRVIHVAPQLLEELLDDPDQYFHKMQARSALFDEESRGEPSNVWLYFGLYVLAGLVFAALCGYLAVSRGLAPLPWFAAGLVGNVAAFVVLMVTPRGDTSNVPAGFKKVPVTASPLTCPRCGRLNHPSATTCAGCHADLSPAVTSDVARTLAGGGS